MIDHSRELNNLRFFSTGVHRYESGGSIEGFIGAEGSLVTCSLIKGVKRWSFQANFDSPVHSFIRFSELLKCIGVWEGLRSFGVSEQVVRN